MRAMFGSIASRYDFVTRLFSYGMDMRWKRLGVKKAPLPDNALVLDLAAGTHEHHLRRPVGLDEHVAAAHTRQFRQQIDPMLGSPYDERLHLLLE